MKELIDLYDRVYDNLPFNTKNSRFKTMIQDLKAHMIK